MITLLCLTDGRQDLLLQTLASFERQVSGPITRRVLHDDSGDPAYRAWLVETFAPDFEILGAPRRSGFGEAIARSWRHVAQGQERFVFHLEDDFTFEQPVDLADLARVLDLRQNLIQLALRRQPWNPDEHAAGGVVEQFPDDYTDVEIRWGDGAEACYLSHRRFFTTNPSLYRSSLCREGWPTCDRSEGHFTHRLLADPMIRFGFWGARDSDPWVHHIGHQRVGTGY